MSTAPTTHPTTPLEDLAFYCVTDAGHFLGLVALVNSLRVLGHDETVYVLDCGLEQWQRELLAETTCVVSLENSIHPMLMKAALPLMRPAQVMVVVDVDVIFTRRLDELVELAADTGKPVLFPNDRDDRFEPGWERLGFGPPVPHTYVASGQFVLPAGSGEEFLALWAEGMRRLANDQTLYELGLPPKDDPFFYPDMDVLNAMVGPAIAVDSFVLADRSTAAYWPFRDVRIKNARELVVEFDDGSRPFLLHHILTKPWNGLVAPNPYSRLMSRLLCEEDVAVRVPVKRVPKSLRSGIGGATARLYVSTRVWLRRSIRGKLGIRARLARRRHRLAEASM